MTKRDYKRLSIEDFGKHLLLSGDLDPIYIALNGVEWPEAQKKRFLVAYWCCYHAGASCWLSEREGDEFWKWLTVAAHNSETRNQCPVKGRWPRAPERRHWRGLNAVQCVEDLVKKYPAGPEGMVDYVTAMDVCRDITKGLPYEVVERRVKEHVAFGPWIAFKVADMLERCMDVPIEFPLSTVMYEDPTEAALRLWRFKQQLPETASPKQKGLVIQGVVNYLLEHFGDYDAPPGGGRKIGLQEIETILCKWKSHMNGHYPLDNDLYEIGAGLLPWTVESQAAKEFHFAIPKAGNLRD